MTLMTLLMMKTFLNILLSNLTINVSDISNYYTRYGSIKSNNTKQVDSETLSKRWKIYLGKAKNIVTRTTQRGVQSCLHPMLGHRYPNHDQILHYNNMPDPVYSDTLKYGIVPKRWNKYGQANCTSYGWSLCHPMVHKSDARDILYLMFKRDGVPLKMIVEKSKYQSLVEFACKCRETERRLVNSEPYYHWTQMYEGCIRELKRGSSRQLVNMGQPKRLWYHCIELQALICSHTAHGNYELDIEVPETCITVQKSGISNICKYSWHEWVMFLDQPITYPGYPVILGRYLILVIDVGSAMTYITLESNGDYFCRTTVCSLIPTELVCSEHKKLRDNFDASVLEALGPSATISDFYYK